MSDQIAFAALIGTVGLACFCKAILLMDEGKSGAGVVFWVLFCFSILLSAGLGVSAARPFFN